MKSIKMKFLVIFGLVVFFVCLGLGSVSFVTSRNAITVVAEEMLLNVATESAKVIEAKLNYQFGVLNTLANSTLIRDTTISKEDKLAYLEEVATREGYNSFGIGDTSGKVMIIGGMEIDLSEREYYQSVLKGNQEVTDPIISASDGNLIVNYAVPIKDKNDAIIGVLIGARNGDELSSMTNEIQVASSGQAYMLNKTGVVVAHYDQENVLNQVNMVELGKSDASLEEMSNIAKHTTNGETGYGSYNYKGVHKLVAYTPVGGTGWFIGVTVNELDILTTLDSMKIGLVTMSIIFFILGLITVYIITVVMVKNIKAITSSLNVFSKGDFSKKPEIKSKSKDELGEAHDSLALMQYSISCMIKSIQGSSDTIVDQTNSLASISQQMASASDNISFSVQETGKATTSQAEGLSDINQIVTTFGEKINNIVINIENIDSNTKDINNMSTVGNENMNQLNNSVIIVSNAFTEFANKIQGLNNNISQITEITTVINNIAEQTNLLSLNAAIEAARAGEFGKGFAVVASEIRQLAEQSQKYSHNIDYLISNISGDATIIINTTDELSNELDMQVGMINNAIDSYRNIVTAITDIGQKIQTVSTEASDINNEKIQILDRVSDASSVSEEVASSSEEISATTQQLNASSLDVATSAENLTALTKNMQDQVGKFKI
ncbi:MAG: methyl-accepting chemotaxis protein [Lachnotalea sp.]